MRVGTSVRFRLTLWNAGVLALLLGAFAYASWSALSIVLSERGDAAVSGSARAIAAAVAAERRAARARGEEPRPEMARDALREILAGDLDVFIVDEASHVVAASRRKGKRKTLAARTKGDTVTHLASVTREPDTLALPGAVRALLRDVRSTGQPTNQPVVRTFTLEDGPHRAAVVRIEADSTDEEEPAMMVAAIRAGDDDLALLTKVRNAFLLAIPLALLVSIACGYAIARRSLAPVEAMAAQAARISAATLDERLPVANEHDELGRLATVVNALLERVDNAFRQQRQFVADASHELRTPIAIVRGEADVTLQRATREEPEYREALTVIREESVRLTRIVDDLFLLARADAGAPVAEHKPLDLRDLAVGVVRSVRTIADDRHIALQQDIPNDPIWIEGDAPLLRRLLLNLLDNALKYTPRSGRVGITLERSPETVSMVVYDSGPGISPALRARVFDRFVRAAHTERAPEHSESASSGAGLGLAIAAAIATAHHGVLTLEDNDGGARFRITLPLPVA